MSASGLKVFVVEDEAMIRLMVIDMLEELGHTISADTGRMKDAMELARFCGFDLGILDVNIGGELITPAATIIAARGLPIIFTTGYGALGLPVEFDGHAALPKPFELRALATMIDKVIASG